MRGILHGRMGMRGAVHGSSGCVRRTNQQTLSLPWFPPLCSFQFTREVSAAYGDKITGIPFYNAFSLLYYRYGGEGGVWEAGI